MSAADDEKEAQIQEAITDAVYELVCRLKPQLHMRRYTGDLAEVPLFALLFLAEAEEIRNETEALMPSPLLGSREKAGLS